MKAIVALVLCIASGLAQAETTKIAVLPLGAKRVPKDKVEILDELLVTRVAKIGTYQVISAADINAMLGLERSKEALGCDNVACAADIGGALGADLLLAGSISSLGGELIVSLRLIDIRTNNVRNRAEARVEDSESRYRQCVDNAVSDLFGASPALAEPHAPPALGEPTTPGVKKAGGPSPGAAVALSLLPGGGMFYLGEKGWGAFYATLWGVGCLVAVLFNPGVLGSMLWIGGDVVFGVSIIACMIHSGVVASERRDALAWVPPSEPSRVVADPPRHLAFVVPVLHVAF